MGIKLYIDVAIMFMRCWMFHHLAEDRAHTQVQLFSHAKVPRQLLHPLLCSLALRQWLEASLASVCLLLLQ